LLPALPFLALPTIFVLRAWGGCLWLQLALGALALWSLVATWGLTLADQAFPPDTIHNPLLAYAWPNWLSGNIARNYGTLLGLRGANSLMPLALAILAVVAGWSVAGWLAQATALKIRPLFDAPAGQPANPDGYIGPSGT
jgi:hypothetical protein